MPLGVTVSCVWPRMKFEETSLFFVLLLEFVEKRTLSLSAAVANRWWVVLQGQGAVTESSKQQVLDTISVTAVGASLDIP